MIGKLFGKKESKDKQNSTQAPSLSPAIRDSILQLCGSRTLPSMPRSAHRAFQLSIDPNASLQDFIEIIEGDEGLASRIIRIANSVYFGRPEPCTNLNDAVVNIGLTELKNLLNANTLCDIFPSKHPGRAQLWMHNVAVGLIARELANRVNPDLEGEAFLAGLMHDIGKLFLMKFQPVEYEKLIDEAFRKGEEFCKKEEDAFICNHCEIGQFIGEKWHFPDSILEVIALHHTPIGTKDMGKKTISILDLVRAGDLIAHILGLGHPTAKSSFQRLKEKQMVPFWNILKVNPNDRASLLDSLKAKFDNEYELYVRAT